MRWNLTSSYLSLPELFYSPQAPFPVSRPSLVVFNQRLAHDLGLGDWEAPDLEVLAGNASPTSTPFAQAYAGHQYAHLTMLGDGRALVLGEHRDPEGRLFDVQLKGSGPTPYSRNGDGRAALGPMLREYLMGEAFHGLGIPTTRALAVVKTGELVQRAAPQAGAVLTRVAHSHMRVGTFEFAAATGDLGALADLADYAMSRHFPGAAGMERPVEAFLGSVVAAQARLVAQWMAAGFVHGVMNTDNMAISGQTLDYGPCAFLDTYHPGQVFSSIDRRGRYAYGNQPGIAQWNLTRLAEALLPLLADDEATSIDRARPVIEGFAELYQTEYLRLMTAKLGLGSVQDGDRELVDDLLAAMEANRSDYPATFRGLTEGREDPGLATWTARWRRRLEAEPDLGAVRRRMGAANPVYYPRNHLVEEALSSAVNGDLEPFLTLVDLLASPFSRRVGFESYERPPEPMEGERPYVTFCGT